MTEKTIKLASADSADILLSDEKGVNEKMENEQIQNIAPQKLAAFKDHPFQVRQDEDFQKLVDSIKENGVLIPAIARPKGDSFELIAGHRRKLAATIAGLETIPVLVRELNDEQAIIAMVDSNVQRENILPSEKAFAYKMKLEALNKQGKRTDLTSTPVVSKFRTNENVGKDSGDSREQIRRYVRLTELIPQILQLVDDGKIAFRPAVELSYLPKKEQELLLSTMEAEQATPSLSQAQKLKAMSSENTLTEDSMMEVMLEQKANQKEQVRIPYDKVKSIIHKDMPPKELEDFILKAVTRYQAYLNKQKTDRDTR